MNMQTTLEETFSTLSREERGVVITHGAAIRLSDLKKRLFLAESKMRHFEEKYQISLAQLDVNGLPEQADYEMHEEYIMWHHWDGVANSIKKDMDALEKIVQHGPYNLAEPAHVGD